MMVSSVICPHYLNDECLACRDARLRTEGAKAERERIVAYLKSLAKLADAHSCSGDCYHCGEAHALRYAADRIENHEPKESGDG